MHFSELLPEKDDSRWNCESGLEVSLLPHWIVSDWIYDHAIILRLPEESREFIFVVVSLAAGILL